MDAEAKRIRDRVAKEYRLWTETGPCYDEQGIRQHVLRAVLWDIDHPAEEDQTVEIYKKWRREVEPPRVNLILHQLIPDSRRPDLCVTCGWSKDEGAHTDG